MLHAFVDFTKNTIHGVMRRTVQQVLLYFNQWFSSCFFALTVSTYAYKGWRYYYPSWALELEVR